MIARLAREPLAWAHALGELLRAGVCAARGEAPAAAATLVRAADALDALDMRLYANAARVYLGGDAASRAEAAMRAEDIRAPARLAAMMAPGFATAGT